MGRIELVQGDITREAVDAIVNAANASLLGGGEGEAALLASCHRRSIETAAALGCRSVSFPAISTGAYGYPTELAAPVALSATAAALDEFPQVELVRFVLFDERTYGIFATASCSREPPSSAARAG